MFNKYYLATYSLKTRSRWLEACLLMCVFTSQFARWLWRRR